MKTIEEIKKELDRNLKLANTTTDDKVRNLSTTIVFTLSWVLGKFDDIDIEKLAGLEHE